MATYVMGSGVSDDEYDDPRCHGCSKLIDDGSVVQFGDGIWHFECFRCSKCRNLVECYSNLLLLRDGSPICEKCSYNCLVCNKPIKSEAIMAGEMAYHADCFRCVQCYTKMDDLIFRQTNKGVVCPHCHENRKHQRQKRKQDKHRQQQNLHEGDSYDRYHYRGSGEPATYDHRNNRSNVIHPDDNIASPDTPSAADHQISTNFILNDHAAPSPILPISCPNTDENVYQRKPATSPEISMKELIELNNMLNAAIQNGMTDENIPSPPPESHDLLAIPASKTRHNTQYLQKELENTKAKLSNVEFQFDQIKDISRKALDEYSKIKERFGTEMTARQHAEEKVTKLQNELSFYHHLSLFGPTEFKHHSKEELAQLHDMKTQMDKTIIKLRKQRDIIVDDIGRKKFIQWDQFSYAHQQQLASLQRETDDAKLNYDQLVKAREDIIAEMIMLNNKNAELSTLNNDLTRRMSEREREAMAFMAGTSFLTEESTARTSESSTGRPSLDQQHVSPKPTAHRSSFTDTMVAAAAAPRKFKFGRNRSKSSGHDNGSNEGKDMLGGDPIIGSTYDNTNQPISAEKTQGGQLCVANHLFNHIKSLRPSKCDACGEKIWRGSELKCQECNIICHTKCVYRTSSCQRKSTSDSVNSNGSHKVSMFGQDLIKQVQSEDYQVPLVVRKCIEAVEQRGMDYEGIYRKSGGVGQMRLIQQSFEHNEEINLVDEDQWNDIGAVTSVLKQYFRDLPNPLFTFEHHQKWVDAILLNDSKSKPEMFQKLLYIIPVEHLTTLKYLMQHLAKVNARNSENFMTAKNLAVVFGPTLMRHTDENMDLVEMNHKIGCIEFILNHMEIFDDPVPEGNKSAPLPIRKNSLPTPHRREASIGLRAPVISSPDI